jgi:hypothetical protein
VAERGDAPPLRPAQHAEPTAAAPEHAEAEQRHISSVPVPTHEVTGPQDNPKRGWWRRVIDR